MRLRLINVVIILFAALLFIQCSKNKTSVDEKSENRIDFNSYSINELTKASVGNFVKPVFTADDSSIIFSSSDFSSIWESDLFNSAPSLIYKSKYKILEFIPLRNSDTIFAVEKSFNPKDKIKSRIVEINNHRPELLLESSNTIHKLSLTSKKNLVFMIDDSIRFFDRTSKSIMDKINDEYELIKIDSTAIRFSKKNRSDEISLTNHQNVIWVEKISQDSILIYSPQDKLILLSFQLKDIVRMGDYQNPKYNRKQRVLAFIKTSDDGLREMTSDVFLMRLNNHEIINITKSPKDIESNISWSNDGTKLAFDVNGQIKIISFNYKNPKTK